MLFFFICGTFWLDFIYSTSGGLIILVGVASTLSLYEFYQMAAGRGFRPFTWLGLAGGLLLVSSTHWWGWTDDGSLESWKLAILLAALLFACFAAQVRRPTLEGTAGNIGITMFGVLYIPFLSCFFIGIDHLESGGAAAVLFVIFVAKGCDIGAYAAGRIFGGPKLAPVVSPNKTVAGAIGGTIVGLAIGLAMSHFLVGLPLAWAVGGSLALAVTSQLGDLCESMLKRDLAVKDAGTTVPGFGGVLDLLDCLLTAAPVGYLIFYLAGAE